MVITRQASRRLQPPAPPPTPQLLTPSAKVMAPGTSQDGGNGPFLKPFKYGFKRELVIRNESQSHTADVYYCKDGQKMRSKSDVRTFLKEHGEIQLTLDNFIFKPVGVSDSPHEVVRQARAKAEVGNSNNVILSRVQVKSSDDDDWLPFHRYKVIERRLSDQLGAKLEEIDSLKPGAVENVRGQIVMDNVKVTYSLRRRQPPVTCVVAPRGGKQKSWKNVKEKHIDESVCKYRNYGSLFGKNNVVRAELAVVIERLPLSDLQRQENVPNIKVNKDARSSYFTGELDVKPGTPREKKVLKLLFKGKGQRKRKLDSPDSENVSLCPPKERSKASFSQPAPAKDKGKEKKTAKSCKESSIKEFLERSKEKRAEPLDRTEKEDCNTSVEAQSGKSQTTGKPPKYVKHPSTGDSDERAPSKHKAAKDLKEKVRAHSQSSPRNLEIVAKTSSAVRDPNEKHLQKHGKVAEETSRTPSQDARRDFEKVSTKSLPFVKNCEKDRKEDGRIERRPLKESKVEKAPHKGSKAERQPHPCRIDGQWEEKKLTKMDGTLQKVPSRKEKGAHFKTSVQENLPRKSGKKREAEKRVPEDRLKQLLMDCGLSDSESDDENVSKKKKKRWDSSSKTGSSSPLRALQEDQDKTKRLKRESLEDFDFKWRKGHGKEVKAKESSASLCKSLLFGSDDEGEPKKEVEKYDPTAAYVLKAAAVPRTVSYSPSPVKKSMDMLEGCGEEAYIPMKKGEDDFSSLLSPIEPSCQKNLTSHAFEEYVPMAMSPARSTRGRYEEYVPRAITSTARRQLHAVDYVPTPKKDASRSAYVSAAASRGDMAVPELEDEIKSARDVKDLEDKHIKYLFYKCIPDMEGIMKKKVRSWRNDDYHQGGKAKRMLTYKVYFSAFSNEQIDLISGLFIDEYVIRKNVSGDYLNQVLLPEFLIRVFMATNGTSHEESDRLMAATPFKLFDVPTHL